MIARDRLALAACTAILLAANGCAYFNTLYNARQKFHEAAEIKRKADPERLKITPQEERLYTESFERAARVVKYWPESDWVDDALLLMGKASFEKGDYSTALRKFDEILTIYPDSDLCQDAMLQKGRTQIATKDLGEAVVTLNRAAELGGDRWRADVLHHLGLVRAEQGDVDGAIEAFSEVVHRHRKSVWAARSGLEAGRLERDRGNLGAAVGYYDRVRGDGQTAEEKFLGGMRKGDVLFDMSELESARDAYAKVAKEAVNEERRGQAMLAEARTVAASGDVERAEELYGRIVLAFPRKEAAAEARFAIAELHDQAGDLAAARTEYEAVKEEGTGHDAWQRASARATEIQRVTDLRAAIEAGGSDRDKNRFLLAEHLLEEIGDTDGSLGEYSLLAEEARGTEWGARALFAKAWVLEHRLGQREAADSTLFQLANSYSGTEADAVARQRFGFPVWKVEKIEAPKVVFVRTAGETKEIEDVVLERVTPPLVPLPPGKTSVSVWVRVGLSRDGSVEESKVVKSGGPDFDQAALGAARASRFVAPNDGGPEFSVLQYVFTAAVVKFGDEHATRPAQTPRPPPLPQASQLPQPGAPADSLNTVQPTQPLAPADSVNTVQPPSGDPPPSIRDLRLDGND